jgi:DnaJ-class molecular chaperone
MSNIDLLNYCNVLEFNNVNLNTISLYDIKKRYKFLCLKYHPDKNLNHNTTEKFQEISEAYSYMEIFIKERDKKYNTDNNKDIFDIFENNPLNKLFNNFENIINNIKSCNFNKLENINNIFSLLYAIIKNTKLLESIDYDFSIDIINILKLYSKELGVTIEKINELEEIVNKRKSIKTINLIPSINNLINFDLYKLEYNNDIYYIPLWHHELIYEFNNHNLLIKINPKLDDNIIINDNNDIHINITENIINIFNNKKLNINIGNKTIVLESEKLKIKEKQLYIIKKEGIPIINNKNIYDTTEISNIVLHLNLV